MAPVIRGVYIGRVELGFTIFQVNQACSACKNSNPIKPTIFSNPMELKVFALVLEWVELIGLILFLYFLLKVLSKFL